jgi:hypothetical protein
VNEPGPVLGVGGLVLRLARPLTTDSSDYLLEGRLDGSGAELFCDGGSLQIQNGQTGLVDEVFFASDGQFAQTLTLPPDSDTPVVLALCDGLGTIAATAPINLRHRGVATPGEASVPTVQRAIAVEVLARSGQRRRQMLIPAGVRLPAKFSCVCRTTDQCGHVVVPLWEEDRLVTDILVDEIDPRLPVGSAVDVEVQVEADRAMTLRVLVRQAGRGEVVQIPAPAAPGPPSPGQIAEVIRRIEALLSDFHGNYGQELQKDFAARRAALDANDGQAGRHFEELCAQRDEMEVARLLVRFPPLQRLTQLVKRCLFDAADLADRTGRDREQLFQQVYAQEQAAEQAHAEHDVRRFREAFDNLLALAADLERLQTERAPASRRDARGAPSAHDVLDAIQDLQSYLAVAVQTAEQQGRSDLVKKLQELDGRRSAWAERGQREPALVWRDVRKALADVARMEQSLTAGRSRSPAQANLEGMLEGSL